MPEIDLRKDAVAFRSALESRVREIAAHTDSDSAVSAIEVGYECCQGGWIFVHPDRRQKHERDGEWTVALDDDGLINMPHWDIVSGDISTENEVIVHRIDGSILTISLHDEKPEEQVDEVGDPFPEAVGMMILEVLMAAKADGVFSVFGPPGTVQLDIDDFNGAWGWPEYDELGEANLV